jgi:hypothetical protein
VDLAPPSLDSIMDTPSRRDWTRCPARVPKEQTPPARPGQPTTSLV